MKWITADNLEAWGRTNSSEPELPGLVADLISATAKDITSVRFPSGDKGRTRGLDGILESDGDDLFIPAGKSIWEIGTETDYKGKALDDFTKRSNEISASDQKDITLVLVTPFTWDSTKNEWKLENWEARRKTEHSWKDVVVIDGSRLELWLAAAPAVAAWHAKNTLKTAPVDAVRSTDEFWSDFANRFSPPLIEQMLTIERESVVEQLLGTLMGPPGQMSLIGDATDEVIAFAIAAIRSANADVRKFLENRTLVVDTEAAGRGLVTKPNLAFLLRDDAARSPGKFAEVGPTILPRGGWQRAVVGHALVRQTSFAVSQALEKMGLSESQSRILAKGCGGSLAALERQIPGGLCEAPPWMDDASTLLPAFLAGSWDAGNAHDQAVLTAIAGTKDYATFERLMRPFMEKAGSPILREQSIYKVRAPLDAFIHSGHLIGPDTLDLLRPVLTEVFGRIEPEQDSDEPIYMRKQPDRHSEWLRDGLAATLLLIAVWEKQARLAIPLGGGQAFADEVISALPGLNSDVRLLMSLESELPMLAEAAPVPFLSALEQMLEGTGEVIRPIFDEVEGFAFPTSRHTGMLWAIERLAWDPKFFRRACLVLARLDAIDPGGRLGNRPEASLADIFLLWLPSTFATLPLRLSVLDEILRDYPNTGWKLVLQLMPEERTTTTGTAKPRLRGFDVTASRDLTWADVRNAQSEVCTRALELATGCPERMQDLLRPLFRFRGTLLEKAIVALEETLRSADPAGREALWSQLIEAVKQHKRFATADWALPSDQLSRIEAIADMFAPKNEVLRVLDLFDFWSFPKDRAAESHERATAVAALARTGGTAAIIELTKKSSASYLVLQAVLDAGMSLDFVRALARDAFASEPTERAAGSFFEIYRQVAGIQAVQRLVTELHRPKENDQNIGILLTALPAEPPVWQLATSLGPEVEHTYWSKLNPRWTEATRRVLLHLMIGLVRHDRPLAALETAHSRLNEIPSCVILSILDRCVSEINNAKEPLSTTLGYEIGKAFEELDCRNLADVEVGRREYAMLSLLERSSRPLRLHRLMETDPDFFHEVLRNVYKEETPAADGEAVNATEAERVLWRQCYKLLSSFSRVPGLSDTDQRPTELARWVDRMRQLAVEHDRRVSTELIIGNVLAHSPVDDIDSGWPHRMVREEIERAANSKLESGVQTERFNMRGVTVRGMLDGGAQERTLAAQYREHALTAEAWPRTSAMLMRIAENWERHAEREDSEARQRRMRD